MRILYDHQVFSLQNTGGISVYFFELLKYLAGVSDAHTKVIAGFSSTKSPLQSLAGPRTNIVHWGPRPVSSGMMTYAINELLLNSYSMLSGHADIYHSTLYRFMPAVRATRRALTHHDCVHERFPHLFPDNGRILRTKRSGFEEADLILCVSESSRNDLLNFYRVDPAKTRVVHNGVEAPVRSPKGAAALANIAHRPFLLYVGLRASYKNFNGLLKAFAQTGLAAYFDLLVLGGGVFTPAEQELVSRLHLSNAVLSVPYAEPALLAEAYAQATLFVYPSLYEGFGIPPLEAMSMATPALVARNPATVEVCGDAAIFFDPEDDHDFASQLLSAVTDEGLRQEKIAAGLQLVPRFAWSTTAQQTLTHYRDLL